jgi:hypothetical protein
LVLVAARAVADQRPVHPGLGGALHLDLYIGEKNMVNFIRNNPMYLTLMNTKIACFSRQALPCALN